jgi:hypothetical protein
MVDGFAIEAAAAALAGVPHVCCPVQGADHFSFVVLQIRRGSIIIEEENGDMKKLGPVRNLVLVALVGEEVVPGLWL